MSKNNKISKEEWLAVNVAGLRLKKDSKHSSNPSFYYDGDKLFCIDSDWKPFVNIEQAFMLLSKFEMYKIHYLNGSRRVDIYTSTMDAKGNIRFSISYESLMESIVECVLKVSGYYE